MSFLQSLTPSQRDAFLEQITFVDRPVAKCVYSENMLIDGAFIVNYSQMYTMLSTAIKTRFPFPEPSTMRNGDMMILGGYRGVGTYYALWLAKDLISHDEAFATTYETMIEHATPYNAGRGEGESEGPRREYNLSDYPLTEQQWQKLGKFLKREDWYDHWPEGLHQITDCVKLQEDIDNEDEYQDLYNLIVSTYGQSPSKKRKGKMTYPTTLLPRCAPSGVWNDGDHHLYLFVHPDEMGYFAPSAFSSVKNDYFQREYESIVLDPLLTHSCSYYGYILHDGNNHEGGEDLSNKLGYCDRFYSAGDHYSFEDIEEWVEIEKGNSLIGSVYLPNRNYFQETRDLFSRHFEWLNSKNNNNNSDTSTTI